jgi:choline-glycine betaine transporter
LVLDGLSAGGKTDTPRRQSVFWIFLVGAAAIALLLGGGLRSLQSGSVVTGLPFMVVIALICVGTMLGLVKARKVAQSQSPPKSQSRPEP